MYYAHSKNLRGERHSLVDHLRAVAETASAFATHLDASTLAYYAGLWHDIGKFHPGFQAYLARCEVSPTAKGHGPDHKASGASLAMSKHLQPASLLIQGHHGGLRNRASHGAWLDDKTADGAASLALQLAQEAIPDLFPLEPYVPPAYVTRDPHAAEMFLRLVFSALVDADFLDTERHFSGDLAELRGSSISIDELWRRFEAAQAELTHREQTPVNRIRNAIYQHCIEAADNPGGLFRLTVPTGGGKTRSAMAFALRHAIEHGHQRVIVAVPFISITEQTAGEYRKVFGQEVDDSRVVLEHHSLAGTDEDETGDFHARRQLGPPGG